MIHFIMFPRFKGLTQNKIENYAHSNSDFKNDIDMPLNCPIDESRNEIINDENTT